MGRPGFHLAVSVDDLATAREFYGGVLGLAEGRSTDAWVDWDFHGHQLVTHLHHRDTAPGSSASSAHGVVDGQRVPVPHFGLLLSVPEFHALSRRLRAAGTAFAVEPGVRFAGEAAEQWTMFLHDPAGNALEFKAFADEAQVFAR
ncbi:VOC family protein [Streptomyces sp. BR123]|uniref:VOC family protein n=1 Tax=Streptomyces sp. BR123 TaxID=2749828 RepID=UPI0015C4293D|nr:VOC family protein [Streptomyces sp. BR123]NXY94968.1 VOC family protein [Streptomyces sp. BR123]